MAEISGSQGGRRDDLAGAIRGTQGGRSENHHEAVGGTRHLNLHGRLMFLNQREI